MEVNVKIEAPDLSAAILKLAEAITPKAVTTRVEQPVIPTASAPITPAPTTPAPAPGPTAAPVPTAGPTAAPVPTAGPSAATVPGNAPAPVVPVAAAPSYSMEQIATAGAALVDAGKRDQLLELRDPAAAGPVRRLRRGAAGPGRSDLRRSRYGT